MKTISGILALIGVVLIAVFYFQNQQPQIELVLLGQSTREISLSNGLLLFYAIGIGVGLLLSLSWAFQDALLVRRIKRQAGQLFSTPPRAAAASSFKGPESRSEPESSPNAADQEPAIQPDILAEGEEPGDWLDR